MNAWTVGSTVWIKPPQQCRCFVQGIGWYPMILGPSGLTPIPVVVTDVSNGIATCNATLPGDVEIEPAFVTVKIDISTVEMGEPIANPLAYYAPLGH